MSAAARDPSKIRAVPPLTALAGGFRLIGVLTSHCPKCCAEPGAPCRAVRRGRLAELDAPHAARRREATRDPRTLGQRIQATNQSLTNRT